MCEEELQLGWEQGSSDEMKEMSLFLEQKAHARAPGVVSASSPICSPSSLVLSVPAVAKLPSQPSLSCAPSPSAGPGNSQARGGTSRCGNATSLSGLQVSASAPGCQGSRVALPAAMLSPKARLGHGGSGLGLAVFAPCLPGAFSFSWAEWSRCWRGFSCQ